MKHPSDQKWHIRFLELTTVIAGWSKDPSRGVGSVIVSPDRQIIATGFNGLPRGVEDLPERLERPTKYDLIVHAEMNAIIQCDSVQKKPIQERIMKFQFSLYLQNIFMTVTIFLLFLNKKE